MNKLEQGMVGAIRNAQEWDKDNTKIRLGSFNGNIEVYLHDNHLATVDPAGDVYINENTVSHYPSKTTVSRLKALGINAKLVGRSNHPMGVSIDDTPVVTGKGDNSFPRARVI